MNPKCKSESVTEGESGARTRRAAHDDQGEGEPQGEAEQRFQKTVECAPVGLAHVGPAGEWLWVNERLCAIVGYTRQEMLERSFQDITHPDDLSADMMRVERMLDGAIDTYAMEKRYIRKDGSLVWVSLTVSLIRDTTDRPLYFISVVEDISARKQLEDALRHAEQSAAQRARELGDMLNIVSHELKTPLTSMKARAQVMRRRLQRGVAPTETQFEQLDHDVARMQRLIDDLNDASRIEMSQLDLALTHFDLRALCQRAAEDQTVASGRVVGLRLPDRPLDVRADPARVEQVLTNLLTNALKYSPTDRPVTLSLRLEGQVARIAVQDEGPGIAPDALQHLFERFYRVPGVRVQHGSGVGLGLGLYISRSLIERQGGTMGIESTLGAGSTFWFTLPLAEA